MTSDQGVRDHPRPPRREPTLTSSDNETWEPQPPALLPPWHTPEREKLQEQARRFAMDEVLPVAQRARPAEGRDPGRTSRSHVRAGLVRHHRAGRERWPGARRLRVLHGERGARPLAGPG